MKVLTAAQMREVDRLSAERYSISGLQLMENAAAGVVDYLEKNSANLDHLAIVVVCGKGNNGGDGFAIARLLRARGGRPVAILCAGPEEVRGDAGVNLDRYRRAGGEIAFARAPGDWPDAKKILLRADIVLDALFGTGLRGSVEGWLGGVIDDINSRRDVARIVAVDIPSGLSADVGEVAGPAVDAHVTITFTAPKIGQLLHPASQKVGRLVVVPIGSPRALVEECSDSKVRWLEPGEISEIDLNRRADVNKGDFGHALVVAGSVGKTGAAVMAGWAALRSGAGLVTVATPEPCLPIVSGQVPEMMTEPLAATDFGSISASSLENNRFAGLLRGKAIAAIGPGLSTGADTQQFIRAVVRENPIPTVLDADGLNALAGHRAELAAHKCESLVITPHPGEMARLIASSVADVQRCRIDVAKAAATEFKATVVLKGHETVIASPEGDVWVNSTGNPGMAKGGTGDVLTGMLAGILAQHGRQNRTSAVCLAVYLHGLAGDLAAREIGEIPLMATDLIRAIPRAYSHILAELAHA
ncbi:MAG: NAD(P)H-hydrate dehydratase, partial [Candidatus Acidiferrales bacterium]